MANILQNLQSTVIAGIVLTLVMIAIVFGVHTEGLSFDTLWWTFLFRWLHVLSGVMWIGKVIAPAALWWFRWGAMATIVTGLLLAGLNGYLFEAILLGFTDGVAKHMAIGIGMWLGTIMFINVWFVIWPNQKKALGIVDAGAEEKAKAARTALLFSRTNTLLSIPMLYAMVSAQNLY